MLLAALSFFFGCFVISIWLFTGSVKSSSSYMYTPDPLVITPKTISQNAGMDVICYSEDNYQKIIKDSALRLAVTAQTGLDNINIYTSDDGHFSVFKINTNKAEACMIATGNNWQIIKTQPQAE